MKPILYSGSMVNAILEGRKTQTRRIVKPQPEGFAKEKEEDRVYPWPESKTGWRMTNIHNTGNVYLYAYKNINCPYGSVGDRLWVRENGWERPFRTDKMLREGADTWAKYYYDADGETGVDLKEFGFKRRPSIFMPRWASRITLEITGIRVERLQDISEEDAIKEGIKKLGNCSPPNYSKTDKQYTNGLAVGFKTAQEAYKHLWESINGPGSWNLNPWVWVVEFKRIK